MWIFDEIFEKVEKVLIFDVMASSICFIDKYKAMNYYNAAKVILDACRFV
jgi:hypothetical protein